VNLVLDDGVVADANGTSADDGAAVPH
jgi:hypothetical protein